MPEVGEVKNKNERCSWVASDWSIHGANSSDTTDCASQSCYASTGNATTAPHDKSAQQISAGQGMCHTEGPQTVQRLDLQR